MKQKNQEEALIKKAMRGSPKAFGELIQARRQYLYRIAFGQTHNEQAALDVVQESILKAYKNIKTLKNPEYFQTWLTRITINAACDEFKKNKSTVPMDEAENSARYEGLLPEEKMDLYNAIERLPEKYRALVSMKYFSDMTIKEIAEKEKMPEGTVSVYLSRALKAMKKDLSEDKEAIICKKA